MSNKNKLNRFADVARFENVLEPSLQDVIDKNNGGEIKPHPIKGNWKKEFFKNENPLVLELACGGGEYTVALARQNSGKNYLGVDIKGARLWKGAKIALDEGLGNAGFLRTRIDFITSFFAVDEVDEIWITFPDPQPQKNRARKRLTAPLFIDRYRKFLKPGAVLHLKHDNDFFFNYTLEQIETHGYDLEFVSHDIYADLDLVKDEDLKEILQVKTYYEEKFSEIGHVIKYLRFRIT
ncbi:tRNA (guanosine(46)-N7)-methyltransferase TrmB [bacterium SCSIO 12643]|nr:tRNA (guanosine(46)-N7)-methyltransferase TrmB [bacterium SCSIO 12643]